MLGFIEHDEPSLFTLKTKNGQLFRGTERWSRKMMAEEFGWSRRTATRAAQKIPQDAEELCRCSFLRQCISTRDYSIPDALRVNIDQTLVHYQDNNKMTWHPRGHKQISVLGIDEKRAFTVLVGVSAAGALLPFQIIMKGKSVASIPTQFAPMWQEATDLGFHFAWSSNDTHWSTQKTMREYVIKILAPHFTRVKDELQLPPSQECLLQLDCWSVHL